MSYLPIQNPVLVGFYCGTNRRRRDYGTVCEIVQVLTIPADDLFRVSLPNHIHWAHDFLPIPIHLLIDDNGEKRAQLRDRCKAFLNEFSELPIAMKLGTKELPNSRNIESAAHIATLLGHYGEARKLLEEKNVYYDDAFNKDDTKQYRNRIRILRNLLETCPADAKAQLVQWGAYTAYLLKLQINPLSPLYLIDEPTEPNGWRYLVKLHFDHLILAESGFVAAGVKRLQDAAEILAVEGIVVVIKDTPEGVAVSMKRGEQELNLFLWGRGYAHVIFLDETLKNVHSIEEHLVKGTQLRRFIWERIVIAFGVDIDRKPRNLFRLWQHPGSR
jgi:hypothetical protein